MGRVLLLWTEEHSLWQNDWTVQLCFSVMIPSLEFTLTQIGFACGEQIKPPPECSGSVLFSWGTIIMIWGKNRPHFAGELFDWWIIRGSDTGTLAAGVVPYAAAIGRAIGPNFVYMYDNTRDHTRQELQFAMEFLVVQQYRCVTPRRYR